jgi:hypothetical protein
MCRILKVIHNFGKHCSCHLQGEYVLGEHFVEAVDRSGTGQEVGYDGSDWWIRRADCYPIGNEHVVEEKR